MQEQECLKLLSAKVIVVLLIILQLALLTINKRINKGIRRKKAIRKSKIIWKVLNFKHIYNLNEFKT